MPISKHSQRLLQNWAKQLPKYRSHCNPWERYQFDKVTISEDSLVESLHSLQEAQQLKRAGNTWYRAMYPLRCFQHVLWDGLPFGPAIIFVYLLVWYLIFVNLSWQPLRIEYKRVMKQNLSWVLFPHDTEPLRQKVNKREEYRQKVWEIQLEGQWIEFTNIPAVDQYDEVDIAYQQVQVAKKLWPLLPEIKQGVETLGWDDQIESEYWLQEWELTNLHTEVMTSLQLQPRAEKVQQALSTLDAVTVTLSEHPYRETEIVALEEQLLTSAPLMPIVKEQMERITALGLTLDQVAPEFAFPYTEDNVAALQEAISTQIALGNRLENIIKKATTYNLDTTTLVPKRPLSNQSLAQFDTVVTDIKQQYNKIKLLNPILKRAQQPLIDLEKPESWPKNVHQLYDNRSQIPTIQNLLNRAKDIGISTDLSLTSSKADITVTQKVIELNEGYLTERQRLLARTQGVGWSIDLPVHPLPLSDEQTSELMLIESQVREMEPLLRSIKQIEQRFGITVERPFTQEQHDLYKSLYRVDADINASNIDAWLIIVADTKTRRYPAGEFTAGCYWKDKTLCPEDKRESWTETVPQAFEMMEKPITERLRYVLLENKANYGTNPKWFRNYEQEWTELMLIANRLSRIDNLEPCYFEPASEQFPGIKKVHRTYEHSIIRNCTGWRLPMQSELLMAWKRGHPTVNSLFVEPDASQEARFFTKWGLDYTTQTAKSSFVYLNPSSVDSRSVEGSLSIPTDHVDYETFEALCLTNDNGSLDCPKEYICQYFLDKRYHCIPTSATNTNGNHIILVRTLR